MKIRCLTKTEVAVSQLRHAVNLFLKNRELISVITLAGASEEILGKLTEREGHTNALDRRTKDAMVIFEHLFKVDPESKPLRDLKNKARNELKHIVSGEQIFLDLQKEAIRLLDRAIENYKLLHVRAAPFIAQYEKRRQELRDRN